MRLYGCALAAVMLIPASASASLWDSDGRLQMSALLRTSYFSSSRTVDDRVGFVGVTGQFKLNFDLDDDQRFDFHARYGEYGIGRGHDNGQAGTGQLLEALWFRRAGRVDLRLGEQRISWGRADGINPTDFFTPYDYTTYLPLEEDQRLPVPAARIDIETSEGRVLSLVGEPGFSPSKFPEPSNNPVQIRTDTGAESWRHGQGGMRYSSSGENFDWSLSAFRGYDKSPVLSLQGANANGPVFVQYYQQIWGLGADVAHNFGQFGTRAELAYVRPDAQPGRLGVSPYLFLVSGIDRSIDDWNFNVQAVIRHTFEFRDPNSVSDPASRIAAIQNAIIFGQDLSTEYGMTARIGATWLHQTLQGELLGFINIEPHSLFLRPLVTYAIDDRSKILFGGEYYGGGADTFFGEVKKNRTVFVEYRRSTKF
jgi:hypothetical protein